MSKKLSEMIENFIQEACSFNIIDDTESKNITTHKGCNHQLMIILREKLQLDSFKEILQLVAEESFIQRKQQGIIYNGVECYEDCFNEDWFEEFTGRRDDNNSK